MPSFRSFRVTEILSERPGLQRVRVTSDAANDCDAGDQRAYCLTKLTGEVAVGEQVLCNTTAVELGLGTGGWHVVHVNLSNPEFSEPGPDHIMKLRYTSLQFDAGTSELTHSEIPQGLDGTPVVVCQVHSQLGVVAATIGALRPGTRVTYVMTDGASLPLVMSDLVANLRTAGLLSATVTAGHAFGGDLEAVNTHSALPLAKHVCGAEIIVIGMGPGVVGTGTTLGTTAIEAAPLLDAVRALNGEPILALRASEADARDRHQGISHHTATVLRLTTSRPHIAAPRSGALASMMEDLADAAGTEVTPHLVDIPNIARVLDDAGLRVTTMGRDIDQDRIFFDAAGAAGAYAVLHLNDQHHLDDLGVS